MRSLGISSKVTVLMLASQCDISTSDNLLMEELAKDAELGLLIRHALAAGGRLALAAISGEALVGGHPAGALQVLVLAMLPWN